MERFLRDVQNDKFKTKELKQKVRDFIHSFEYEFQEIWNESNVNEYENGEAIEGIVTKALYNKYKNLIFLFNLQNNSIKKIF